MKNRLTNVPATMPTIRVNDNGYCKAEPISPRLRKGRMAKMVVSEVMTMGRKRLCPPRQIAVTRGIPSRLNRFIVSTFRIESLIMIPLITTMPIIDMIFSDSPNSHRTRNTQNTSITISDRMTNGCTMLSNCAARMKYSNATATLNTNTSSPIIFRLE